MSHIVIHDDSSNVTHYAEFGDLPAAVSYLEGLMNENNDSNARLYSLEPVEFAVKSYVRVEIGDTSDEHETDTTHGGADPAPATPAPELLTDEPVDDTVEYVEAAMAPVESLAPAVSLTDHSEDPTAGESRRGLFGR